MVGDQIREQLAEHYADRVMTKKQVAQYFNTTTAAIEKMCVRGQIPYHTKGKHKFFSHKEIIDYFLK